MIQLVLKENQNTWLAEVSIYHIKSDSGRPSPSPSAPISYRIILAGVPPSAINSTQEQVGLASSSTTIHGLSSQ